MKDEAIPINWQTWSSFIVGIKRFATSEEAGRKTKWLLAFLVLFLLGINTLNVLSSYVSRDFMTAIENRNLAEFIRINPKIAWGLSEAQFISLAIMLIGAVQIWRSSEPTIVDAPAPASSAGRRGA